MVNNTRLSLLKMATLAAMFDMSGTIDLSPKGDTSAPKTITRAERAKRKIRVKMQKESRRINRAA